MQFSPVAEYESSDCKTESKSKRRKKGKKDNEEDDVVDVKADKKLNLKDVEFVWAYSNGERVSV